jgi:hypothetical protein
MAERDTRFLRWRFFSQKAPQYSLAAHYHAGECDGLAITRPGVLLGRPVTFLVEFMVSQASPDGFDHLMQAVLRDALAQNAAAVMTFMAPRSAIVRRLRRAGFWYIPKLLRPRPYNVCLTTDLIGQERATVMDLASWHMSLTDSDLA